MTKTGNSCKLGRMLIQVIFLLQYKVTHRVIRCNILEDIFIKFSRDKYMAYNSHDKNEVIENEIFVPVCVWFYLIIWCLTSLYLNQ